MGQIMKKSKGQANPKQANEILLRHIQEILEKQQCEKKKICLAKFVKVVTEALLGVKNGADVGMRFSSALLDAKSLHISNLSCPTLGKPMSLNCEMH